mmetsp:Transcript_40230/g.46157  ORF Transcript_40230/g.46157 Transcript_40230/m.46157 type:complete len:91 (-) Transcript_40230:106-378(-)|eukprot:CAMPEP_0168333864 /NCGR_PEP_ID=MMETSP0213-20121227/9883_1 /TAXON_ID=151035 /ORGANISM="Euplotes harpa, Strain FSP1.4" /LENGTH=90 /DNA_ID=CAMNT_0008338313 /DNA_START=1051 /DNA_END=1323 /DNA_ORIENTATION=-
MRPLAGNLRTRDSEHHNRLNLSTVIVKDQNTGSGRTNEVVMANVERVNPVLTKNTGFRILDTSDDETRDRDFEECFPAYKEMNRSEKKAV